MDTFDVILSAHVHEKRATPVAQPPLQGAERAASVTGISRHNIDEVVEFDAGKSRGRASSDATFKNYVRKPKHMSDFSAMLYCAAECV